MMNATFFSSSQKLTKKMMQSDLLLPTWPNFNFPPSALNQNPSFDQELDFDFSYSFPSPDDSSANSYAPTMFFDLDDQIQNLDDHISTGDIEEICEWINIHDTERSSLSPLTIEGDQFSPGLSFESFSHDSFLYPSTDMSLILPGDSMEVDEQLTLIHLLRAYGEATANSSNELAEVIVKSINEKSSVVGNTIERVTYNLFQSRGNQGEYLRQEAAKNVLEAFRLVYESLPNGRFAHFGANSAILESIPDDAQTLHVVDFDIGEGIQWPSLIEALSKKQKAMRMRLTSIRREGESTSSCWEFEGTKRRLLEHSRQHGVELQVEEKSVHAYCNDLRMKRRGEWLVFNCMVGLPHMGRRRSRKSVDEFLNIAKESRGIVILGDGEATENSLGYASYFDNLVRHYQAVFESLETNFPAYLAEARTAMESLFLAPFMSPLDWLQEWEETTKSPQTETQFEGRRMSLESLVETKEMVNEGENGYSVRIEGVRENEMVLQWKQTPLVRVSTWM